MAIDKIESAGLATSTNQPNFRNTIINGDMSIAQRATSTASITGAGVFVVDRWKLDEVADSTLTMSQETLTSGDAYNNGFKKSLKVLVTTADTSVGSSQSVQLMQHVEAQNLQYLNFGTANAKNLTLSFWYKSNVTGVHTVCIDKSDSTRTTCPLEFTVSSADTWTKYTLNANANAAVQGSSGAIANDNGTGFRVMWGLLYGTDYQSGTSGTWEQNGSASFSTSNQQNILATNNNYVEITGVQLEAGTSASDFEFLPFDINQQRCQRYFNQYGRDLNNANNDINVGVGSWYNASEVVYNLSCSVRMRSKPTLTSPTVSSGYRFHKAGTYSDVDTGGVISNSDNNIISIYKSGLSSGTGGQATWITCIAAGAKLQFDAEL